MNLFLMQFFQEKSLPSIKDGMYVRNLDDKNSKQTYWVSFFFSFDRNTAAYFDSFGIEYIPQELLNKIKQNTR